MNCTKTNKPDRFFFEKISNWDPQTIRVALQSALSRALQQIGNMKRRISFYQLRRSFIDVSAEEIYLFIYFSWYNCVFCVHAVLIMREIALSWSPTDCCCFFHVSRFPFSTAHRPIQLLFVLSLFALFK